MESNFTAGIIIGIIIGIVAANLFTSDNNSSVSATPQVQTRAIVVPSSVYTYDYNDYKDYNREDYDYDSHGLHVR